MMYIASKLFAFAIEPLFWVVLLLLAGVLLLGRRPRAGRQLCRAALLALLLCGWTYPPSLLIRQLEAPYQDPPAPDTMQRYVGVVVLGGAFTHSNMWTAHHNQVALNDMAERMTMAVSLARRYPHLRVLFTGGDPYLKDGGMTEAQRAKIYFDEMGTDPARVTYESASRNTFENADLSAKLPGVDRRQNWLLLTSAFHMPRSMGVFRKTGWNVTPYPVDYRSGPAPSWNDYSLYYGPHTWQLAVHEIVGYAAYRWTGRI